MIVTMLTTIDNPYDPFDNWDQWYQYDTTSGHHCSALLDRIATLDDELSEADTAAALDDAINEILRLNVNGMYTKVSREFPNS